MRRILVVEDISETRRWLVGIAMAAYPDCDVEEAVDRRSGISAASKADYDLALIDLGLPDGSGIDVLRYLRQNNPETICVVTTVMGEDSHIVAALSAGAQGYLLKEQPEDVLRRQLAQLTEGVPALSPSIARRIMEHFRLTGPAGDGDSGLSAREKDVLALIGRGLRNADVADILELTENTVASHIKAVYRKLGISSRAEASWHSMRLGLTTEIEQERKE